VVERILPVDTPLEELEALAHADLRTTAVMLGPPQEWLNAAPAATHPAPADTPGNTGSIGAPGQHHPRLGNTTDNLQSQRTGIQRCDGSRRRGRLLRNLLS